VAQLLITDIQEEIIEESPNFTELKERPKTESVLGQLSALEPKKNLNGQDDQADQSDNSKQIALTQGGEALIQPTASPFSEADDEASTVQAAKKEIEYYTVQSGDTLSAIARSFGVSVNTILWENNLSLNSYIRPGDKLAILPISGVSYTIQSGDTLSSIATKFGTTVDKILSFNNLESAAVIKARQKLIIPGGKLGYTSISRTRSIYTSSDGSPSANNFLWPASSKRITQYYHWRHHAIDIGGKTGQPIYASRAGRVEKAGWTTGYGYNIVLNHGGGVKTLYAHASQIHVKRGQQVEQGEVIGAVGSTGWSTGPHIHFEIIISGSKVNPLSYL
jgi:murein DD-endopeptidase MepM/ murein hydrolase activator NlpD